ncbi:MAG: HAD-IIIC family phosphatase, partial [Candidatus Levyibacteriota bacterium]
FIAFQQVLLDFYNRGILLAINSRNNPEDALAVIRSHPNMILKEPHFAAMRINWDDKAENIQSLAKELNIGLDSMVFLDDDPVNRFWVETRLPEVAVPELPADPAEYAKFLLSLAYFPSAAATDEDTMRGNMYVTERLRREAEKTFENRKDFLKALDLSVEVYVDDASALTRLSQLTGKTNQFNINKKPFSEEEIQAFVNDPRYAVFYARALDRFGDHGIISFALAKEEGTVWTIESLLMSCRVLGRGIEDAFMSAIAETLKKKGATEASIMFTKSEKNAPAEAFVQTYFKNGPVPIDSLITIPAWIERSYGNL